jgi:hypothetical protein
LAAASSAAIERHCPDAPPREIRPAAGIGRALRKAVDLPSDRIVAQRLEGVSKDRSVPPRSFGRWLIRLHISRISRQTRSRKARAATTASTGHRLPVPAARRPPPA